MTQTICADENKRGFWYSEGEQPNCFLNARVKLACPLKPTAQQISATVPDFFASKSAAGWPIKALHLRMSRVRGYQTCRALWKCVARDLQLYFIKTSSPFFACTGRREIVFCEQILYYPKLLATIL